MLLRCCGLAGCAAGKFAEGTSCTLSSQCCSNNCIVRTTGAGNICKCMWGVLSAGKGHMRLACNSDSAWGHVQQTQECPDRQRTSTRRTPVSVPPLPAVSAGNAGCSLQAALPTSLRLVPRATTIVSAAAASAEGPTLVSQRGGEGMGELGKLAGTFNGYLHECQPNKPRSNDPLQEIV